MKRTRPSGTRIRALDARLLGQVRGGDGLGITVVVPPPPPTLVQMQHNETLVAL